MIKEKKKKTIYNYERSYKQIALSFTKTILCSLLVSLVITVSLVLHARNEMIKDIFASQQKQNILDKKVALEIITQTNLLKDLKNKSYSVCMHAGEIYEIAEDYLDAQKAYELAIEKASKGNYTPYYKLICVLAAQEKFDKAEDVLDNIDDVTDKRLIKFKTRAYLTIGDKYYSIGKFLSAAKMYEKAKFYYNKFSKKDKVIEKSILQRIINSYINVADLMVKSGLNSDAIRFLKKAEAYSPDDFNIKYKLAIVLSDLDPEKSIEYIEALLDKMPQEVDYRVYNTALMKAANIADLEGRTTRAKYYRYKIHSIDLFLNRKVIYKNDIETSIKSFNVKKVLFHYPINVVYQFLNVSSNDILTLEGDFVLCENDKPIETITINVANKKKPMYSNNIQPNEVNIKFNKKVLTKKELDNYTIKVYLYKDKKYKTFIYENKVPQKSF